MAFSKEHLPTALDKNTINWCLTLFQKLESAGVSCSVPSTSWRRPLVREEAEVWTCFVMVSVDSGPAFYLWLEFNTAAPAKAGWFTTVPAEVVLFAKLCRSDVSDPSTPDPTRLDAIGISPDSDASYSMLIQRIRAFKASTSPPPPMSSQATLERMARMVDGLLPAHAAEFRVLFDALGTQCPTR